MIELTEHQQKAVDAQEQPPVRAGDLHRDAALRKQGAMGRPLARALGNGCIAAMIGHGRDAAKAGAS
jgi:hypothetical protein